MKMRRYGIIILLASLACLIATQGRPATIIWRTHEGAGAMSLGVHLEGIRVPGSGPANLANGALIQLIKGVGAVDNPYAGGPPDPNYWSGTDYTIDDIILDEVHAGYGLGPPGAAALGEWSRTVDVDIAVGDVLYARAYSRSKSDFSTATDIIVGPGWSAEVLCHTVTQIVNRETYYFDNLGYVPEPSPLTFLAPGLALWGFGKARKKKQWECSKS